MEVFNMTWIIPLVIIVVLLVIFIFMSVKIVRESEVYIIERLGKFHKVANAGLTIIIPFIDHVRSIVSLKQQTLDIPPQEVITKDNVTITINTVVFYSIINPADAVYKIQSLKKGIEYLSVTSIRDVVGKMDLDSSFSARDSINDKLRSIMDEATANWGCRIDRVEIQDITPPPDIRDAMEKQMNAERNKRAAVLQAEGERQAAILKAQGDKEAAILQADAEREAQVRKAAGEADAIRRVAEARADEVKLVYGAMMNAKPDEKLVQLKSLETLKEVASGDANKVFIPFEATAQLSSLGAAKEVVVDEEGKSKVKDKEVKK
jgi:regulator of protease activity HflC (stomatin/prohibitin superfamily)